MKVKLLSDGTSYSFYCPGCGHEHVYYTAGQTRWQFNGDVNKPTFTPSLLNRWGKEADPNWQEPEGEPFSNSWSGRCHLFVTNGVINYCNDCTHPLSGKQGVEMKEYDKLDDIS